MKSTSTSLWKERWKLSLFLICTLELMVARLKNCCIISILFGLKHWSWTAISLMSGSLRNPIFLNHIWRLSRNWFHLPPKSQKYFTSRAITTRRSGILQISNWENSSFATSTFCNWEIKRRGSFTEMLLMPLFSILNGLRSLVGKVMIYL